MSASLGRSQTRFGPGNCRRSGLARLFGAMGAIAALTLGLLLASCGTQPVMPTRSTPPSTATDAQGLTPSPQPRLMRSAARMPDGYRLPFQRWGHSEQPQIVVLGLHGFNDYSQAFEPLGKHLAKTGVTTYAFDQRGFGRTRQPGLWHGSKQLTADLRILIGLLRAQHPQARLILAGESMGAAVALSADATAPLDVDGLLLIAPAVWSRNSMPWYQRLTLDIAARVVPGLKLTGEGVSISPSDNQPMLIAMGRDPLVIKATRIEALWGVTNLMDQAVAWRDVRRRHDQPPTLVLYGERDSIIPPLAFCRFISAGPVDAPEFQLLLYAAGWHMLPRDLQGARVRTDIATWAQNPSATLPSAELIGASAKRLRRFCSSKAGVEVDAPAGLGR